MSRFSLPLTAFLSAIFSTVFIANIAVLWLIDCCYLSIMLTQFPSKYSWSSSSYKFLGVKMVPNGSFASKAGLGKSSSFEELSYF